MFKYGGIIYEIMERYCNIQGSQTGGGGGVGVVSIPPPLNFGWGVEHLSTPPDFEKKFLGGVGSP